MRFFYQLDKKLRVIWQEGISIEKMLPPEGSVSEFVGHFSINNQCGRVRTMWVVLFLGRWSYVIQKKIQAAQVMENKPVRSVPL